VYYSTCNLRCYSPCVKQCNVVLKMFLFVTMAADFYFRSYGNICSLPVSSFVGSARYRFFAIVPCPIVVLLLRKGVRGVTLVH